MGIETLTVSDVEAEVERVIDALDTTGEARISLEKWGERSLCKNILKKSTEGMTKSEYEASFDGDANEFVVRLNENEDAEDEEEGVDADASEDDEGDVPF